MGNKKKLYRHQHQTESPSTANYRHVLCRPTRSHEEVQKNQLSISVKNRSSSQRYESKTPYEDNTKSRYTKSPIFHGNEWVPHEHWSADDQSTHWLNQYEEIQLENSCSTPETNSSTPRHHIQNNSTVNTTTPVEILPDNAHGKTPEPEDFSCLYSKANKIKLYNSDKISGFTKELSSDESSQFEGVSPLQMGSSWMSSPASSVLRQDASADMVDSRFLPLRRGISSDAVPSRGEARRLAGPFSRARMPSMRCLHSSSDVIVPMKDNCDCPYNTRGKTSDEHQSQVKSMKKDAYDPSRYSSGSLSIDVLSWNWNLIWEELSAPRTDESIQKKPWFVPSLDLSWVDEDGKD